jgi:hypothetical protein
MAKYTTLRTDIKNSWKAIRENKSTTVFMGGTTLGYAALGANIGSAVTQSPVGTAVGAAIGAVIPSALVVGYVGKNPERYNTEGKKDATNNEVGK